MVVTKFPKKLFTATPMVSATAVMFAPTKSTPTVFVTNAVMNVLTSGVKAYSQDPPLKQPAITPTPVLFAVIHTQNPLRKQMTQP